VAGDISMAKPIRIRIDNLEVRGELVDSRVATQIWTALPINSKVNLWGDEIYFTVPVKTTIDTPQAMVKIGDLAYWPDGPSLCIFFGRTPISDSVDAIKPASDVEVVGKLTLPDTKRLKNVKTGETITVEKIV
jgi:hypothetical protein